MIAAVPYIPNTPEQRPPMMAECKHQVSTHIVNGRESFTCMSEQEFQQYLAKKEEERRIAQEQFLSNFQKYIWWIVGGIITIVFICAFMASV